MTMQGGLSISGLTLKSSQGVRLQEITFNAQPGELIGLIGANGAGKSSLLKVMAGLLAADTGTVFWNQQNLLEQSQGFQARERSYLPQHEQLPWPVASLNVIQLGFSQLGMSVNQQQQCLDKIITELELESLLYRPVTELSGGEQQRVLLARALVGQQSLLLVDEPCAGLDIAHQLRTLSYLKAQAQQRLVVMAIHDLALAARYCDRLVLLDAGQLLAQGTPAEVLTDNLLARAFGIKAKWFCGEQGVAMLPIRL